MTEEVLGSRSPSGDLEEGELLTSDEEDNSNKQEDVVLASPVKDQPEKEDRGQDRSQDSSSPSCSPAKVHGESEEGEIYSSDEEAVYYPQRVKRRSLQKENDSTLSPKRSEKETEFHGSPSCNQRSPWNREGSEREIRDSHRQGRGANRSNRRCDRWGARHSASHLADVVKKRREKGQSLLPTPKGPTYNNLDKLSYPAPPSWYLDTLEEHSDSEVATSKPPAPALPDEGASLPGGDEGKASGQPVGGDAPAACKASDTEDDYDKYLDQLDEEEDGSSSRGGGNPLDEAFPMADSAVSGPDPKKESLIALIGFESSEVQESKDMRRAPKVKSAHRKQKENIWRRKQREREQKKSIDKQRPRLPCKFFKNGTCKHGNQCTYIHELPTEKKKEICKFYLQDSCSKGNNCLYYHGDFPCKFHHVNFCIHGANCKFSHDPLTPETHKLLSAVLESSNVGSSGSTSSVSRPLQVMETPACERFVDDTSVKKRQWWERLSSQSEDQEGITEDSLVVKIPLSSFHAAQNKHKVLLPTPPPQLKLNEEDLRRSENMNPVVWVADMAANSNPSSHCYVPTVHPPAFPAPPSDCSLRPFGTFTPSNPQFASPSLSLLEVQKPKSHIMSFPEPTVGQQCLRPPPIPLMKSVTDPRHRSLANSPLPHTLPAASQEPPVYRQPCSVHSGLDENTSVWGMSDAAQIQNEERRSAVRTKYAHLKVKSRLSSSPKFVPKFQQESSVKPMKKPMALHELFGSSSESDSVNVPYGEIRAHVSEPKTTFGELEESSSVQDHSTEPSVVPSYFAHLEELGSGDFQIESAFGALKKE